MSPLYLDPAHDVREQVRRRLLSSPYGLVARVRFDFADGKVVLRGAVGSYYEKQVAQEAVKDVAGVARVCNELEVVGTPTPLEV